MSALNPKIERRFSRVASSATLRNLIATYRLDTQTVLDIGCCYGEFLTHFGPKSVGITIAPEEVTYGAQKGLDIRLGNIESEQFAIAETFDVIFANNIFEHLYSPHQFLRKASKPLKPGGILILGVPCVPKIVSLWHLKKFRGSLASLHINFFTRATLIKTVERGGFIPVTTRGFRFTHPMLDHLFDAIYPHFYVVAKVDPQFHYSEKRLKELAGYDSASAD